MGKKATFGNNITLTPDECDTLKRYAVNGIIAKDCMLPKFLYYYLQSPAFQKEVEFGWTFGTQQNVGMRSLEQMKVCVPQLNKQDTIANYLDYQCSQIDLLLQKALTSIEEYKKLRQAVITQAVTKGVRGEREMKDSGNPWFGQIPADWKLTRVGLHFSIILGKMLCNAPLNDTYTLEPYYCAADVHFDGVADGERKKMWFSPIEKDLYRVSVGDLLVVEGGAGAGGSAIVENQDSDTYIQNSIMIVRSKGKDLCRCHRAGTRQGRLRAGHPEGCSRPRPQGAAGRDHSEDQREVQGRVHQCRPGAAYCPARPSAG